jgi:triacylglycerol lipase
MTNVIATSTSEIDEISNLLEKKLPTYRQAYSDRTAWVMACIAELSYLRFNPLFGNEEHKKYFLKGINKLAGEHKKKSLEKLIDIVGYDHEKEKIKLENDLSLLKMELVDTFDSNGTQAIIVSNKDYTVLGFRGTEATSIKDIKSDLNAKTTTCETGGNIHTGFRDAFNQLAVKIQERLNQDDLKGIPLYITGHSLGGALATIASKKLSHNDGGIAACYTYGAPRVGDEVWLTDIKTPIYRVVNAADCVTMMPPGDEMISIISWLFQWVPCVGKPTRKWLLANFQGYLHCGDMRYMTNCKDGNYNTVKLLHSVSLFYRLKGFINKKSHWSKLFSDHSISIYRKKSMIIAKNRNNKPSPDKRLKK